MKKAIWLFGLSGSGKTTLAGQLALYFDQIGELYFQLDGDCLRKGLNSDLGFSSSERNENIRRIAELAKLCLAQNLTPVVSVITPYKRQREMLLDIVGKKNIILFFIDSPLNICEQRDIKGLYKQARHNNIKYFTGVSDIFELPGETESEIIRINTNNLSIQASFEYLKQAYESTQRS